MASMTLEESLRRFTLSIFPPPTWKDKARRTIDKVFEILKRNSKYGLDRCRIVGGFEKGTSTNLKVDVDTGKKKGDTNSFDATVWHNFHKHLHSFTIILGLSFNFTLYSTLINLILPFSLPIFLAVIYFNDPSNAISREDILKEWEELLLQNTNLKESDIRRTEFVLTFSLNDVPIDIVAVRNQTSSQGKAEIVSWFEILYRSVQLFVFI